MDAASQPTLKQLKSLSQQESEAKKDLEQALESYAEQLPLADRYGVNPRKPRLSEVLDIFRPFIREMCKIRRRTTPDVNAAMHYVYTAVMDFCRKTRSGVAIYQLPDDPAFRKQIQDAIRASMFGSESAIQREPRAKIEEAQQGTLRTDAAQCLANDVDRFLSDVSGSPAPPRAGGQTRYETHTFGNQVRYHCPYCQRDDYDLARMDAHVQFDHTSAVPAKSDQFNTKEVPPKSDEIGPRQAPSLNEGTAASGPGTSNGFRPTTRRRVPDLETSRERLKLVTTLARELVTIKQDLERYCTVKTLKQKHPGFTLWDHIE